MQALRCLVEAPDQPVSAVAKKLSISITLASQHLRALNARGLLTARRSGRWVYYRPTADETIPEAQLLLGAIRRELATGKRSIRAIFRLATAFTHPRREEIFRALYGQALTVRQLNKNTEISIRALRRHLRKLESRGLLVSENGVYRCVHPSGAFGGALSSIVTRQK
ncbi:MAG: helix-turn-helix domain-containing protein [Planctomycetes bacterium]|nr:helix-turn-helix domain-containing protein [Planctomycetota bacterium]